MWSKLKQLTLILCILSAPAYADTSSDVWKTMPDVSALRDLSFETPMQIYSGDHKLIGEFGEHKRIPTALKDIPLTLRQAFIAIEDRRFYEHSGIDPQGILRAIFVAAVNNRATQGASTITQQTARNLFLNRDKTLKRKLREIFIAWRMEQVLSKDEILELYLNKIALGHRAYGVAAAAQTYYGKKLDELTIAEIATLAGLPKAPSTLNPISNPKAAAERRHAVLQAMLDQGFITQDQFNTADQAPIKAYFHGPALEAYAPYAAEEARKFALDKFGPEAYTGGYQIYTTVNAKVQEAAHAAVMQGVIEYDRRHGYRGPIANLHDLKLNPEDLTQYLKSLDRYKELKPALVLEIDNQKALARLQLSDGSETELSFKGMAWARPFYSDSRQGAAPRRVSDVLHQGDIILVINRNGSLSLAQLPEVEAALIALEPKSGAISAMVGGYDFNKSKFNRTIQAKRQTGSNFKPFLYSAAVAKGIAINSLIEDEPIRTWDPGARTWWSPKNSPDRYDGPMTLREGLARSKNVVSIRLIRQVGVPYLTEHLKKFGIEVPQSQQSESMALGSVETTPLELITGYTVFANGGFKVEPYLITKVIKDGQVLYEHEDKRADPNAPDAPILTADADTLPADSAVPADDSSWPQVLTHGQAYITADMLRSVIYGGEGTTGPYWGTGSRAQRITGRTDLHGKTGTTNEVHDAWFSGFNANLAATAWIGFDTDRNLGHSYAGPEGGAYSALPIWAYFFKQAQAGVPAAPLPKPAEVESMTLNGITDLALPDSHPLSGSDNLLQQDTNTGTDSSTVNPDAIF